MPSIDDTLRTLEEAVERQTYKRMDFFKPFPKQDAFFLLGRTKRERMLLGANQSGKTECGAFETVCHLTGRYPEWWKGRKFDHAVRCWAAGESSMSVRDTIQKKMCGEPGVEVEFGKGMIPRALFVDKPTLSRGVSDAYDTIQVKHITGGVSILKFKSYEQGRGKFQGETLDFVWLDEECPMEIYTECWARTTATAGFLMCTATPLRGRTELVIHYLDEISPDRDSVTMTLYEGNPPPGGIEAAIRGTPIYMRDARIMGVPMMGTGRVFPYPEELIREASVPADLVPAHWRKLWAVDFGIGHPFAAVLLLHDADNDVIHVHHTIRIQVDPGMAGGTPQNHASAMKQIGIMVPVAWPHDGAAREKGDGVTLASKYRKEGLLMLGTHAMFYNGNYSTEAGILDMDQRMQQGKLKVGAHLSDWFDEYRNYHRKDGAIVKVRDDLMSATRIGVMQIRSAKAVGLGGRMVTRHNSTGVAEGLDFDLFGG